MGTALTWVVLTIVLVGAMAMSFWFHWSLWQAACDLFAQQLEELNDTNPTKRRMARVLLVVSGFALVAAIVTGIWLVRVRIR